MPWRRRRCGEWWRGARPTAALPLFVFDAGYDAVQLAQALGLAQGVTPAAILVRLRSGRCFYADPPPYTGQGRPRRHGPKFTCSAPETWWTPTDEHTEDDPAYGRVRVRAWAGVHGKVEAHAGRGTHGPTPIERGTLLLLQVERLPRQTRVPKDVWLWWQGPPGTVPDLALVWRAYIHRFDLEHTFRVSKETLRWTAPRLRHPAQADRWTALVVLAYTQLRLAQPLVADQRLPWERPLPSGAPHARSRPPPVLAASCAGGHPGPPTKTLRPPRPRPTGCATAPSPAIPPSNSAWKTARAPVDRRLTRAGGPSASVITATPLSGRVKS